MGMSHGRITVLLTHYHLRPLFRRLGGVIAFYPYCYDRVSSLLSDTLRLDEDAVVDSSLRVKAFLSEHRR